MTAPMRVPILIDSTRLDARGLPTVRGHVTVPQRGEVYTARDVSDPARLAALLTKLHQNGQEASSYARAHPRAQSITFYGVTVQSGGAKVSFVHNLGRRVLWFVVGWRGNGVTSGPSLVSDELDASGSLTTTNALWLRSYVAGTVDVEVWGMS